MVGIRSLLQRAGWPACAALALACAAVLVMAPRSGILTTIEIGAPPEAIWAVLTDPDDYPAWNPMIAGLRGRLAKGQLIEAIEGYGSDRTVIWPRLLVVDTDRELRWRGHLWGVPGLFIGEHYFLLRPTAHGTLFTQGEHFSGALLWVFDPQELVPAFEAMNVALATRSRGASASGRQTGSEP